MKIKLTDKITSHVSNMKVKGVGLADNPMGQLRAGLNEAITSSRDAACDS
jgi:hypothetical protein